MQQRLVAVALMSSSLMACAHGGSAGSAAPVQEQVDLGGAKRAFAVEYVVPRCGRGPRGALCGLVAEEMTSESYLRELTGRCEAMALGTADCAARFLAQFEERLRARYPRAVAAEVSAACARGDAMCHELAGRELAWLRSHDEHVVIAARREGELIAESWSAHRERWMDRTGDGAHGRVWSAVVSALSGDDAESNTGAEARADGEEPFFRGAAALGCSVDTDCAFGQACTPTGAGRGLCLTPVHDAAANIAAPSRVTIASHRGECSFDGECSAGQRCLRAAAGAGLCAP